MNLEEKVENLIKPAVEEAGCKVKKVELRGQNLIITIDKPCIINLVQGKESGVNVEDCAKASRLINPILDKANLMKQKYYLTVSSPGIE